MSEHENPFAQMLEMGLATVKARQYQTIDRVVRQFANFLRDTEDHPGPGVNVGHEAVDAWRRGRVLPQETYRLRVAELAVMFCCERGLVNRWWAKSMLDSVQHPRCEAIVEAYFPTYPSNSSASLGSEMESFRMESDDTELRNLIRGSTEFWAWATSLQGHVPYLRQLLQQALDREAKLRFLLIEPEHCAAAMATVRAGPAAKVPLYPILQQNLHLIHEMIPPSRPDMLQLRVIDYLGPYTMYVFDRHSRSGQMLLHLSSFHGKDAWDRPTLKLTRSRSYDWFEYFAKQFESVWQFAKPHEMRP